MNTVILMTREEALASDERIRTHASGIGHELIRLKETNGWMHLLDKQAQPYKNWTDFLSRHYGHTRKHLYELMAAAPVIERLSPLGYTPNAKQALALSRFPLELQAPIYSIAAQREGGATVDRINAIGAVMQEAAATGYVTAPDGQQIALEAAIAAGRKEGQIAKRYYILQAVPLPSFQLLDEHMQLSISPFALDVNAFRILEVSQEVFISIWVPAEGDDG